MRVQVITGNSDLFGDNITKVSSYANPMALDDYDIDIIDLSHDSIWKYHGAVSGYLNRTQDLAAISKMVAGSRKATILYAFPQDGEYCFDYKENSYNKKTRIKNIITSSSSNKSFLSCLPYDMSHLEIVFEPTMTDVNGMLYSSDFHFMPYFGETKTLSVKSNKITTISIASGRLFTTLDICKTSERLNGFIASFFNKEQPDEIPEWVKDYNFGNDSEQKAIIESNQEQISVLQQQILDSENSLKDNNRYKSILYTNGDALVEVVFSILEELLDCDLSQFKDEKKEDFLIHRGENVFIGEIKGVSSNVKNEHISQLEVHYQSYLDTLQEKGEEQNVRALLIINPFRTKPLSEREPINTQQIRLAERNGSLIVETATLLKLFELFRNGLISSRECEDILSNKSGLLSMTDVNILPENSQ